ncbi:2-hydroxyacid dehydrogenase [Microvirga arsenatis]|uniref:Glyoxylate/hydroxypyruvate reductase A n=1 Tax=Microvirga arsenatis TaxID=2692265 RepID=A0ABW9Z1Y5_9HYPH|nr:glyoxylate/hydroxypyruvate reductase A [Microvirga arsenatis]NBJ11760.1 glyoxylate/hydroxypyruvate reductase A [Microvirga arsenatis]NBJ25041.1 glyoxylate/hydroxypyruvate reductase A [Microvirga arsenatis]
MSLLVAVTWETQPWVERFKRLLPDRDIVVLGENFDRSAIRYVATWGPKPGSLSGLPNLEAIFSLGAGVDHLMSYPDLPDVPIVRVAQDDLTHRMSEYMVLHCLMYLRDQRRFDEDQKAKRWRPDRAPPIAGDVRVGIMGFGVLGQDSARKLKVMGFDVAGWSRTPKQVEGFEVFAGEEGLTPFLNRTDILIALMPLTPETKGILNRSLFEKLARDGRLGGPILINAGRGKLQVEADILACLDDGTLKAATLDVFETEPLPEDSPLWTHPRVTVTPHNSATSEPEATARYIAQQIRRHEAGEPFENVVDKKRGY